MRFFSSAIVAVLSLSANSLLAGELVLWPSEKAELKAQADSSIAPLSDGAMGVKTGVKVSWPGARLDFKSGTVDISGYGELSVSVSNTTAHVCEVHVSVKGGALQGRSPGGTVKLAPYAAGVINIPLHTMPWVLDAPLEFVGMRGYPAAADDAIFNLGKTSSIHIFFHRPKKPGGFSVSRISVSSRSQPRKTLPAADFFPFVDRFGQFRHDNWPGKVKSEEDLAKTRSDEERWLARHTGSPIPGCDRFGGWSHGPRLKATGFFRTEKVGGKWWFVDPDGYLFFSHGVNAVGADSRTGTTFREKYFEWVPQKSDPVFGRFVGRIAQPQAHGFYKEREHLPYSVFDFARANALRKYGEGWMEITAERAHERMRAWGLNTIANWSRADVRALRRTPYTISLSTGGTPRLKGSKGWWGALPDPFAPEFEDILRQRARKAAATMRDDPWCLGIFVDNELSWNSEPRMADVAERYFSAVSRILREELPNHLYLGCRIAWGTETIYRVSARYCDVVSVNIYDRLPKRDLPPGADDKPMIAGEFHFGALDRGMFHTGLAATGSQEERAECYRAYVNACVDHPRYVGTHWFQWQDQPLTGRGDGENYQIGFVTVTDTPYPELVQAARDVASGMYQRRYTQP